MGQFFRDFEISCSEDFSQIWLKQGFFLNRSKFLFTRCDQTVLMEVTYCILSILKRIRHFRWKNYTHCSNHARYGERNYSPSSALTCVYQRYGRIETFQRFYCVFRVLYLLWTKVNQKSRKSYEICRT